MEVLRSTISIARLLSLFGIVILAAACEQEAPPPPQPRIALVVEANPQGIALSAEASGRIEAQHTSDVGFQVSGRMISREVDLGAVVSTGQLLARINPEDFQNSVDTAQSQVAAAEAKLKQVQAQEKRVAKLLKDGFETKARYDVAKRSLDTATAQLKSARADLRTAENQLKYTRLVAPVAGAIVKTGAEAGQVVQAGQMVVQIAQQGGRDAVFAVSSTRIGLVRKGMQVSVWPQDKKNEKVVGHVREIAPSADPVTGTYTVKVALPENAPADMRLGAIVVGHVEGRRRIMTRLPTMALLQTGDKPQVWVVTQPDNKVKKVPVTAQQYDADSVLVTEGLKKGDLVVVAGVNILTEGQTVKPQKTDPVKAAAE